MDSDFEKIRRGNLTLYIHKNFRNDTLEQALLSGEKELQERCQWATIRSSKFARVYKSTVRFGDIEKGVYFKQYLYRSIWDFIKHLFRASRARRAFKATLMLAENGFKAPTIIAMGECRFGFSNTGNFLVTLEVKDAKQIYQFVPESLENFTEKQLRTKRELIRALGQTIGRMHKACIFHGDLRLGNVLARQERGSWQFSFLDNERTKKFHRLPARLRLKNLVQVNMFRTEAISNADRMRFLKAYLEENPQLGAKRNIWAERVVSKTNKRLRGRAFSFCSGG